MPVEIRPIRPADLAAWRGLWGNYLEFYGTSVPDTVYVSTFARLLGDDDRDFCALVAVQDDVVVGLVHYLFHRHCCALKTHDTFKTFTSPRPCVELALAEG